MTDRAEVGLHGALGDGVDPVGEVAAAASGVRDGRRAGRLSRGAWSWALYEGFRTPYVILITIYVFAPYFATVVVGDAVRGQQRLAEIGIWGGLTTALLAPLLGSSIDGLGARKPGLALCTALMIPLIALLWFAAPAGAGLSIAAVSWVLGITGVLFALSEVFHNSLLTRAAGHAGAPHASGLAYALANGVSVLMLSFVLWAFALPGKVDWGFIPHAPLFGLDPLKHETDRIVAPLVAVVFALGSLPLFLFTPDAGRTGMPLIRGLREGGRRLVATLKSLRGERDAAIFLGARMLYTDGMTALLMFGGVYAAGVMRWGVLEMLAYGILLSAMAVAGGFVGAGLDARLGPKWAIRIEIAGAIVCQALSLGMGREKLFYLWSYTPALHAPVWNGPMFRTWPEIIYLVIGFGTAVFVTASYASSRTMVTRIAPEGQTASYFGLYALSGAATVWLGSLLVKLATGIAGTQQAGFAPIAGLLLVGLVGMAFVKGGGRE